MSNNKQTAVEWLSNQAYNLFEQYSEGKFDRIELNKRMRDVTHQSELMHYTEIKNAYRKGYEDKDFSYFDPENYYNEEYGK